MSITCTQLEAVLADYIDGTLPSDGKLAVENHLTACAACAEFARDAAGAVAFIERASLIAPPPELTARLMAEISTGLSRVIVKKTWGEKLFGNWFGAILQPRFVMGVAMTILSFAMVNRLVSPLDLNVALNPVRAWTLAENRMFRVWDRTVKGYENLSLVSEVQNRLDEIDPDNLQKDGQQK